MEDLRKLLYRYTWGILGEPVPVMSAKLWSKDQHLSGLSKADFLFRKLG